MNVNIPQKSFNNMSCKGVVLNSGDGEYIIKGRVKSITPNPTILFWAANPPNYLTNYEGSGLPYPNPNIAYDDTPNKGAVIAQNRQFEFRIRYPNSYYIGLGTRYVCPNVHIKICETSVDGTNIPPIIATIKLGNGLPFRTLTYSHNPQRQTPLFYYGREQLPIKTQEQILRDSSYPDKNIIPKNFWGLTIPHS